MYLLLTPILFPILAGCLLPLMGFGKNHKRLQQYVGAVVIANTALVLLVILGDLELRTMEITPVLNIYLRTDDLSRFFALLATSLWTLVTFYTFEYIKEKKAGRFYSFYLLSYGVILGACFSGNFFTLYLFYELMTLFTYPLVVHTGTKEAVKAGTKYLMYSFFGAGLCLMGFVFISAYGYTTDFIAGGALNPALVAGNESVLLVVFFLAFLGFGCKAYIWPLFDWVPVSYPVAPAPAASLLSGVVSKVAVLALIRVTFYSFGADFVSGTWVQIALICITLLTVFAGSMLAFKEQLFARRLAYSSVSQLSYILFGIIILSPIAFLGALLHVIFHGIIKVALFLSAGAVAHKTGKTCVNELEGIGKAMPVTLWCFTLASLALVGIPPTGGFISKWYLAMGAIGSFPGLGLIGAGTLLISALLTGGYLIPIFAAGFFPGAKFDYNQLVNKEPGRFITAPLIVLAVLCVVLGMFPGAIVEFINGISVLIF